MERLFLSFILAVRHQSFAFNFVSNVEAHAFAEYEPWEDATHATSSLYFRFKTSQRNCLLVRSSDDAAIAPYLFRLALVSGRLRIDLKMGGDDMLSVQDAELGSNLDDMSWHEVTIMQRYPLFKVTLDRDYQKSLVSHKQKRHISLAGPVFVGGDPENSFGGFTGCIERISYPVGRLARHSRLHGNVTSGCLDTCSTTHEETVACQHGGICKIAFHENNLSCDCLGTGYRGPRCNLKETTVFMTSNVTISTQIESLTKFSVNTVHMRFRTASHSGVLLHIGDESKFILVELVNGYLVTKADFGTGEASLLVGEGTLHDGEWHSFSFLRRRRHLHINVDRGRFEKHGSFLYLPAEACVNERQTLFIGGYPFVDVLTSSSSKTNYEGCLQQIYIQDQQIDLNEGKMGLYTKVDGELLPGCEVRNDLQGPITDSNRVQISTWNHILHEQTLRSQTAVGLSKSTVRWLAGGIVTGCVVLLIILALGMSYVRRKYSGKVITDTLRSQMMYGVIDTREQVKFPNNDFTFHGGTGAFV